MIKINRPVCPNPTALSTDYKHPDNKKALSSASCDKCMYCESRIGHVYFGDIEHIRPKDKYPSLQFEWTNLGYVCAKCNNAKGNKYDSTTPYLDPYDEDPSEHVIAFGSLLKHKQGSERGELTINDIALNRPELIEKRLERLKYIETAIDACSRASNSTLQANGLEDLKNEFSEDKEYSLFVKELIRAHGLSDE